tara:strand:+ start:611 stop:742 length:132 start_codon:yes stop_codon:yes gene_type:complete
MRATASGMLTIAQMISVLSFIACGTLLLNQSFELIIDSSAIAL